MAKKRTKLSRLIKTGQARAMMATLLLGVIVIVGGAIAIRVWYDARLKPVSSSTTPVDFTVKSGESVKEIAADLQTAHLIRSAKAFETYVRANPFNHDLQAGTYVLTPSMNVRTIAHKMNVGDVAKNYLTILPGKRLDQIKQAFAKAGYSQAEIDAAFNAAGYANKPALASLPKGDSLEGYLYPESFEKQSDTPAGVIIGESLDQMDKHLTPQLEQAYAAEGLSTYQAVTLASIVYQETDDPTFEPTVAQVFLSRLKQNMPLGSDVTAFYASAVAGQPKNLNIDSPYNTRLHTGLPPGPIGNVTVSALDAVAHPTATDYLYFVAGDDKKIYFAHTEAEHEQNIAKYCQLSCGP